MLMMLGPFGPERLERSQLMLMMLGLLARNGWKGPNRCPWPETAVKVAADAHVAGPFGPERLESSNSCS